MKEQVYAFFDIDGTLLPEGQKRIPKGTVDAVQKLKETGAQVFICTGRGYFQAKEYIDQIGVNSYITSNGQEAVVEGEEVYSYNLEREQIEYLVDKFKAFNVVWGFETRNGILLQEDVEGVDEVKKSIEGYGLMKINKGYIKDHTEIKQMWVFGKAYELKEFEEAIMDEFKFFRWSENSMEIVPIEESKAKAMEKVLARVEGKVKSYAFGDSINDLELIGSADVGVAMGNAKKEIKVLADYITDDCDKDGIEKALKHLELIE